MLMSEEIDNKAALLLSSLVSDGQKLSGFASTKAALDYDYMSPLRYFPHSLSFSEQAGSGGADPQPGGYAIMSATSQLRINVITRYTRATTVSGGK